MKKPRWLRRGLTAKTKSITLYLGIHILQLQRQMHVGTQVLTHGYYSSTTDHSITAEAVAILPMGCSTLTQGKVWT
jgi:hypothetical protein